MIQARSCYDSVEAKTPGEREHTTLTIVQGHSGWKTQIPILATHTHTYRLVIYYHYYYYYCLLIIENKFK